MHGFGSRFAVSLGRPLCVPRAQYEGNVTAVGAEPGADQLAGGCFQHQHIDGGVLQQDVGALLLYRVDIRSGHRTLVGSWRRPTRIEQAWIAAASRIVVASISPNPSARTVDVGIDAVDIATGVVVWKKDPKISNATQQELAQPVSVFFAQQDTLTYAIGAEHAALTVSTNKPATTTAAVVETERQRRIFNDTIAQEIDPKTGKVLAAHPILWRPSTFRIESGHLYAFTLDGRAYAMNP